MSNVSSNVGVGSAGVIYIAPKGTALPTDATTALDEAFKEFGFISEDGVTISEDTDSESIPSWGGKTVRVESTKYTETVAFTPIECNEVVAKATYGDDAVTVSQKEGGTLIATKHGITKTMPAVCVVIDTVESETTKKRYCAGNAQVTERGDLEMDGTSAVGRELTYTCNADAEGVTMYEYAYIVKA